MIVIVNHGIVRAGFCVGFLFAKYNDDNLQYPCETLD